MARRLLPLALTVERHDDGDYYWRILESFVGPGDYESLMEGASPFKSYVDALKAGSDTLLALCADPLAGPLDESGEFDDDGL
jgi:hypothetical protein